MADGERCEKSPLARVREARVMGFTLFCFRVVRKADFRVVWKRASEPYSKMIPSGLAENGQANNPEVILYTSGFFVKIGTTLKSFQGSSFNENNPEVIDLRVGWKMDKFEQP